MKRTVPLIIALAGLLACSWLAVPGRFAGAQPTPAQPSYVPRAGNLDAVGDGLPIPNSRLPLNLQSDTHYVALRAAGGLEFIDTFSRANTAQGSLGTPPTGRGAYDLRGPPGDVAATATRILNGKWVSTPGQVCYAIQTFDENVTRIGGVVSWGAGNGGTGHASFAMIIASDVTGKNFYTPDLTDPMNPVGGQTCLHFILNPENVAIQIIDRDVVADHGFVGVGGWVWDTPLAIDGTKYVCQISIDGETLFYSIAGRTGSLTDPRFATFAGKHAIWEHYYGPPYDPAPPTAASVLRIEAIWAGTRTSSNSPLTLDPVKKMVGIGGAPTALHDIYSNNIDIGASNDIAVRKFIRLSVLGSGPFMQLGLNASGDFTIDNIFGTPANLITFARDGNITFAKDLPTFADDAAAGVGGLTKGRLYVTSTGQLMRKQRRPRGRGRRPANRRSRRLWR